MTFQEVEEATVKLIADIKATNKGLENQAALLQTAVTLLTIESNRTYMEIATIVENMYADEEAGVE